MTTQNLEAYKDEKFLINICDQEPIHIPGSIQNFGFAMVLGVDANIKFASANVHDFLGKEYQHYLGKDLSEVTGDLFILNSVLTESTTTQYFYDRVINDSDQTFDVAVLPPTSLGYRTIEFQPKELSVGIDQSIEDLVERLQLTESIQTLFDNAVECVREVIGYARVKLYMFDEFWNGDVVAESKEDFMPTYKGMRFPATDIPRQARELYVRNKVRIIADVNADPVPLFPEVVASEAIDLSDSGLRSISPIHIEYLRNMGVSASFSASVVQDGKLIGLIACHHNEPKTIGLRARKKCEIIGRMFSIEHKRLTIDANEAHKQAFHDKLSVIAEQLRASEKPELSLSEMLPGLNKVLNFDGIVIKHNKEYYTHGLILDPLELRLFERSIDLKEKRKTLKIRNVQNSELIVGAPKDIAGMIRIPIDREAESLIYGFRKERVHDIVWGGGNPENAKKLDLTDEGKIRVSPRKSFEAYKVNVQGESQPYTDDIYYKEISRSFRSFFFNSSLIASGPKVQNKLYQKLERSNFELRKQVAQLKVENLQLHSSEQKLNLALESGLIGTWEYNINEDIVLLDLLSIELLDAPDNAMSLEGFLSLLPMNYRDAFRDALSLEAISSEDLSFDVAFDYGESTVTQLQLCGRINQYEKGGQRYHSIFGTIQDVSDFQQLESEIQAANFELSQFFDSDLMGTFIADENGDILKCNNYFLELLGYDSDFLEKGNLNWRTLSPIDQYPRDLDMIKEALRGERVNYEKQLFDVAGKRVETLFGLTYSQSMNRFYGMVKNHSLEIVKRNKAERLIEDQRRMLLERHQKMQEFNKSLLEANDRLKSEIETRKQFEQSKNLLQHAIDSASEMIIITDAEFLMNGGQPKISYVNEAMLALSGYSEKELIGASPKILQNRNTSDEIKAEIAQALHKREPINVRLINSSKDDHEYVVDLSISPVFDENGNCVNFVGIQKDVSAEVRQKYELERAEKHFKLITNNLPESKIILANKDGDLTYVGGQGSEKLSTSSNLFELIKLDVNNERKVRDLKDHKVVLSLEGLIDNEEYLLTVQLIEGFQGADEFIILAQNIEERRKLIRMKEKALEQASALAEMKTQFINTASHQLKTPMSSIELNLNLLEALESDINNPRLSKVISRLKVESKRLIGLMDETLQISRLNSAGFLPDIEQFDLLDLINDQIGLFNDTPNYGDRSIVVKTRLKSCSCLTDRHLFQHALHNVISNALKYSTEDVELKVTKPKGKQFEITIVDKGIGIPAEDKENLMTEFFRASNTKATPGTGLGLYLVKTIIDKLSGTLIINSTEGIGTSVTLSVDS